MTKKSVVVKLMGGLGNQMFQYAFGKKLSILENRDLYFDLSFLQRRDFDQDFIYRDYSLDIFNIDERFISGCSPSIYVNEKGRIYSEDLDKSYIDREMVYLDGFWQCPKYFDDIKESIKRDFTFKNNLQDEFHIDMLYDIVSRENPVMVNIRRSDYIKSDFHNVMDIDYYEKAKKIIESKVKNPYYYIFSDDIQWCMDNFQWKNSKILGHQFAGEKFSTYLGLMRNCKHFIIPNSSFAWWSAWLAHNDNKIVIHPSRWFETESSLITEGLDWTSIKV